LARAAALVSGVSLLALSSAWSPTAGAASLALPTGGHFAAGDGSIITSGKDLSVNQTTTRGIINWQSFSIGNGNKVSINNGSGATLNRVTGNNPSQIAGQLTSTGSVYVVNTAGVIVMPTGKVFTSGSFVASTRDVSNSSFMAGGAQTFQGTSTASVTNQGTISSANGNVTLIGKSVSNSGKISAANGTVALAAGDDVMLQDSANETVVIDTGTGNATNTGTIDAAQVQLAAADGNVYALATNNGGVIRATGTKTEDGHVVLTSDDGNTVVAGNVSAVNADGSGGQITATASAKNGTLTVRGVVSASATGVAKSGGKIVITAENVVVKSLASIAAKGKGTGSGGDIFVGGDRHGGSDASQDLSSTAIADATNTRIGKGAVINASGGSSGQGGNVIVWSNQDTTFLGNILATGGAAAGNGGFVEVSGAGLDFHGTVSTKAVHGTTGTLLLDPTDVTIFSASDNSGLPTSVTSGESSGPIYNPTTGLTNSYILNTDIDNALISNNVTIHTGAVGDGGAGTGNVHFGTNGGTTGGSNSAPIYWSTGTTFEVDALGTIDMIGGKPGADTNVSGATNAGAVTAADAGILIEASGGGSIILKSGLSGTLTGTGITMPLALQTNTGNITLESDSANTLLQITGTLTSTGGGTITATADQVRLGVGTNYTGLISTSGEVLVQPTTTGGDVLVGNNYSVGAHPDDQTQNTALINEDSIHHVLANPGLGIVEHGIVAGALVIGNANVVNLTVGSPAGLNPTTTNEPTSYPGIIANGANNLEFVTGATGSVVQDAYTPITVGPSFTGGLAVITGGNVLLPDFNNQFGTLAVKQLSGSNGAGTGNLVVVQANTTDDNTGTLAIGVVNDIAGINAPNATVTLLNIGTTTQDTTSANSAIIANTLVLEGAQAGDYASSLSLQDGSLVPASGPYLGAFTLNNTANKIGKIAASVSSLALADDQALEVAAAVSDQLGTATAGSGDVISSTTLSGIAATTADSGTGEIAITAFGTFTIDINAPISSTGGSVEIEAGSPNYGDGTPHASTGFINEDGATAISVTGGGNWRIYTQDPRNDVYDGLGGTVGSPNYAFVQYNAANYYGDPTGTTGSGTSSSPSPFSNANSVLAANYTGTGNGFLYTVAPTVSESITTSVTKVYDATTAVVPALSGTDYSSVSGTINSDVVTLSHPTSATYASKNVGSSIAIAASGISLVSAVDSKGVQVFGYTVTTSATGTGSITPKALTFTGLTAGNKIYDATTLANLIGTAALTGSEAVGSGNSTDGKWYAGDGIGLSAIGATGAFSQKDVGNGLSVSVSGVTLTGNGLGDYTLTALVGLTADITPKALTFGGLTAGNKIYDATTLASLTGTATLTGSEAVGAGSSSDGKWYAGDGIGLTGTAGGTFSQKDVGNGLSVSVSGVSLTGNIKGDYTLTPLISLTANITPKALTFSGLTAGNKIYDATTLAALTGTAVLTGSEAVGAGSSSDGKWYAGDGIGLSATGVTGTFSQKNVGNGLTVSVSGVTLTGNGLGDYTLTPLVGLTANITPKALTFSGLTAGNKIYDATTLAALTGTAVLTGSEAVGAGSSSDGKWYAGDGIGLSATGATGTFSQKDVGNGLSVSVSGVTLTGNSLGDYTLTPLVGLTANITPKALTFSGLTANNKIYDATTLAVLTGTAVLTGSEAAGAGSSSDGKWYAGDGIGLSATGATGTFSQKNVGNGLSVSVSGVTLTGNSLGDYTLTPLVGLTANITPKALTFSGLTAGNKIYDATTLAALTGTAVLTGSEAVGSGNSADGKWYAGDGIGLSATGATGAFSQKDVGNGLSVSVSGVSLTGNTKGDYTLTPLVGLTANITPKALTFSGLTANNKIYDATTLAALTGTAVLTGSEAAGAGTSSDGKWYAGDGIGLSATGATGTFSQKNVGNGLSVSVSGVTLTGNSLGDYTLTPLVGLTANITPKALTFSGLTADNKIYDATTLAALTGTAVLTGSEAVGAGSSSDGKWYAGDGIGLSATGATGAFSQKDVGNGLSVSVSGVTLTGNSLGDYTLTPLVGLTANITPKALSFDGLAAESKVYDGNAIAALTGTAALLGSEAAGTGSSSDGKWYNGDGIGLTGTAGGTFSQKNVGTALSVGVTGVSLTGNTKGDYTLTPLTTLTANITPKALTVSGDKVYDGTTGFTVGELDVTGGITGETITLTAGTGTSSSDNVGTYANGTLGGLTIHVTGGLASNYTLPGQGKLVITPKTLNITADNETKTYGNVYTWNGTEFTTSGLVSGTGDSVTSASFSSLGAPATANVGNYAIDVSGAHGTGLSNYTVVYHTGTLTIDPRTITATQIIVAGTRVYDGTPDANGSILTITNLVNGDQVGLSGTGIATSSDVGTWALETTGTGANNHLVGLTLTGAKASDYTVYGGKGTLTITPLPVIMTGTRVYDGGTDGDATILHITNAIGGDTVDIVQNDGTSTVSSKHVGDRTIVNFGTLELGNNSKGDYTLVGARGDVIITPLPIDGISTRPYNGGDGVDGGIITITNAPPGDEVTVTGTGTSNSPHKGTHPVDPNGLTIVGGPGTDPGDYTTTGGHITVDITPLPVVLLGTRLYDGGTDGNGDILAVTNAIGGDTVDVSGGTSTISTKNVGHDPIVDFGTLTLGNNPNGDYTLVGATGTVIVTPLPITVTAVPGTKTYDGTTTSNGTPIVTVGTIIPGDTGDFIQTYGNPNAGHNITLTPSGTVNDGNNGQNYIITYDPITVGGVIDPAPVSLTGTRPFDGSTDADSGILSIGSGLIGGDIANVAGGTGVLIEPNIGNETIVNFGTLTLGGPDAGNYYIASGSVNITPAFTPPPENPTTSNTAYDNGIERLQPKQNGIVTGTIATNDGEIEQADTQLGCTLGDTGCLQNGVGTKSSQKPAN
jgi:filamentous hemagglutinin family protein